MTVLRTMFATWYIGMILCAIALVPALKALLFGLRCLFWVCNAFQSLVTGTVLPDF